MKLKIKNTAAILLLFIMTTALIFTIASCGSEKANQNAVPHDITSKVLTELNITPADISGGGEDAVLIEYYGNSADYQLDESAMARIFPYVSEEYSEYTGSDFSDYSIIEYDKTSNFPFELVIIKLPKKDGAVDSALLEAVQKLCDAKLKELVEYVENYAQSHMNTVKKVTVNTYDNYVYYCFADKASTAEEIIKNNLTASE